MKLRVALCQAMLFAAFGPAISYAADTLYTNQMIAPGASIVSQSGYYVLGMDGTGTLQILRNDGSVRYRMASGGDFAVMQGDGNFVQYKNPGQALWWTGTANGLNNKLVIHDDGDLAVYTPGPNSRKIWNLGSDYIWGDPSKVGDVLGRDLAYTGAGFLGHIAIWDGSQVIEVGPPTVGNNAVHLTSLFDFKHTLTNTGAYAQYWGTASFNIPAGTIHMSGCWGVVCTTYPSTAEAEARYSVALRAMQVYRIGADYTTTAYARASLPAYGNLPIERGIYRCDTFVLDVLNPSTYYWYPNTQQQTWINRMAQLRSGIKTPGNIYNTLKTFQ